jgi:hypothetical protein
VHAVGQHNSSSSPSVLCMKAFEENSIGKLVRLGVAAVQQQEQQDCAAGRLARRLWALQQWRGYVSASSLFIVSQLRCDTRCCAAAVMARLLQQCRRRSVGCCSRTVLAASPLCRCFEARALLQCQRC